MKLVRVIQVPSTHCPTYNIVLPGSLVRDLRSSDGSGGAEDALRRADEYLARGQGRDRVTSDRTVINTTPKGGELSADEHSCSESEKGNHLVSFTNPPTLNL